jgi:hypothetical protein
MAQKNVKVGDLVDIEFFDHAEDAEEALLFKLCGEVEKITRVSYIISTWRYADKVVAAGDDNKKSNENRFAIVKKAITSIKILK